MRRRPSVRGTWSLVARDRAVVVYGSARDSRQGRAVAHRGRRDVRPSGTAACGVCLTARANFESIYDDQICDIPRQDVPQTRIEQGRRREGEPQSIRKPAGKAAGMESGRSLFRDRRAGSHPRPAKDGCRMRRVRDGLQGQARGTNRRRRRRRMARRGGQALRGDRRSRRPSRLLCRAGSCRRQRRSRDHEILRRRLGAADHRVGASAVLRARTQPHRRCRDRARDADARTGALSPVARGSAQGQAVSARGSRRAAVS